MKRLILFPLIFLLVSSGCYKDPVTRPPTTPLLPPTNPTVSSNNKPPFANTGSDLFFVLPADTGILNGSAWDENNDIEKYTWKLVSGPSSVVIDTPDSLTTKVRNLKKGNYKFEFVVTDKEGLMARDTAYVTVLETGSGTEEIVLSDLNVYCPWECSVIIENFNSLNPDHHAFKIFARKSGDSTWLAVREINNWLSSDNYVYDIYKNNLWIGVGNEHKMDVMIRY
jgi:hypothetical protein